MKKLSKHFAVIFAAILVMTAAVFFACKTETEPGGATSTSDTTASKKQSLSIKTMLSTEELTNQNVKVSVDVTTGGESSVKKISYQKGISYKVEEVLAGGTDITEKKSFEVSENGDYTIAASDTDGWREVTWITVSNIDKTAPKSVVNLMALYEYSTKKITVTWDSSDTDIAHYLISYKIGDESKVADEKISRKIYELTNIEATGVTYTFTIKAVDKAGNVGTEDSTSIKSEAQALVSRIELDRYHIAYNDTNKTINVTVYGSNFDLIDDTSAFKVQLVYTSVVPIVYPFDATVDKTNNKATATITVPSFVGYKPTDKGTDCIIRAKIGDDIDTEHTSTLNISTAASLSRILLSQSQFSVTDVSRPKTTTATVSGPNLDIAGTIALQLYDSAGNAYGDTIAVDTSNFEIHQIKFIAEISIPTVADMYTLKVLFDGTVQSCTTSLQVYENPAFTSFKIPNAGISKQDNTVTATVIGKYFTAPNITKDSFTVSCTETPSITSSSSVTISDDNFLSVTLTIPKNTGEYKVTIASGDKSIEGTFSVKDYSSYDDKIGYIVLSDKTLADSATYTEIDKNNPPVAVVAGVTDYGIPIGVGLHINSPNLGLKWAKRDTTGCNTKFTDIICTPSTTSASTATFTGDLDGSDNWDVIRAVDPQGSADVAANYPAFNWANTYGKTYSSYLGGLTEGWYMPSLAELCYVCRNLEKINATLKVIYDINPSYATKSLIDALYFRYWSSSQHNISKMQSFLVSFKNSDISEGYKYSESNKNDRSDNKVLVVRALNYN